MTVLLDMGVVSPGGIGIDTPDGLRHSARLATTLATGAQIVHEGPGPLFAFSRIDREDRIEYVVVTNNSSLEVPARFNVLSPDTDSEQLRKNEPAAITSDDEGEVLVEVPPLSSVILRAQSILPPPLAPPEITLVRPSGTEIPTPRFRLEAELSDRRYAEVTFSVRVKEEEPTIIGTDDTPPTASTGTTPQSPTESRWR